MNSENEEIGDSEEPMPLPNWRSNLHKKFQLYLDRSVPHLLRRWLVTIGVAMIYILRVYWFRGFHVISYGLATYVLNLLIGFFSPHVDPGLEGLDGAPPSPASPGRDSDEYKPFERRVPEFRFWMPRWNSTWHIPYEPYMQKHNVKKESTSSSGILRDE
uniref:Retrieval of early ER protein Rer1 n=1 Tax=Chenopodium quinoa TaxID=63459 RepID=A0A803KYG8_CHEQI